MALKKMLVIFILPEPSHHGVPRSAGHLTRSGTERGVHFVSVVLATPLNLRMKARILDFKIMRAA